MWRGRSGETEGGRGRKNCPASRRGVARGRVCRAAETLPVGNTQELGFVAAQARMSTVRLGRRFRGLAGIAEEVGPVPSTHMVVFTRIRYSFLASVGARHMCGTEVHMQAKRLYKTDIPKYVIYEHCGWLRNAELMQR